MEIQITKFPLLSNDLSITNLSRKIEAEKVVLANLEKELKDKIERKQQVCPHLNFSKELSKPQAIFGSGNLLSKTCTKCGFQPEKPKGSSETVCDKCWGKMEYQGREAGQGGGTHHYECEHCHHHHTST